MNIFAIIASLLPSAVKLVEILFPAKGSGPVKKEQVKDGIASLVSGIGSVSTGGQKETWDAVATLITTPITGDGKDLIDWTVDRVIHDEKPLVPNIEDVQPAE